MSLSRNLMQQKFSLKFFADTPPVKKWLEAIFV